jgi:hypothetical protein
MEGAAMRAATTVETGSAGMPAAATPSTCECG